MANGNPGSLGDVLMSNGAASPPLWIPLDAIIAAKIAPLQQQIIDLSAKLAQCCNQSGNGNVVNACSVVASFANNVVTVASGCTDTKQKCKIAIFCGTNNLTGFDLNCGQTKTFALTSKCQAGMSLIVMVDGVVIFTKTL